MKCDRLKIIDKGSDTRSVWADVAIGGVQLVVDQGVAERLLAQFPSLSQHACKTGTFGDHLPGALLPHALEHLTIDLLVARHPGETFAGNTCWLEREEHIMRVRISLPKRVSSHAVEAALSEALLQFNEILSSPWRGTD